MKKIDNDIEQLDRYQKGLCNQQEERVILDRLAKDEDYRNLLDDMELMVESLSLTGESTTVDEKLAKLKIAFDEEGETNNEASGKKLLSRNPPSSKVIEMKSYFGRYKLGIAAAFALLIAASILFYPTESTQTANSVAQEFYSLPEAPESTMSQEDEQWALGVDAYSQGDFSSAIESWSAITDQNSEQKYFLAHSYFQVQAFTRAGSLFEELSKGTSTFSYASEWFSALSHLAAEKTEQSQQVLDSIIAQEGHPFSGDAIELLNSTKKLTD